ncbi:MAG: hypothetical protein FJ202_09490 [Gemmatimonadetes bacterium]|nr:hypothetical protein [Gemmatimonadota bacterium]
MNRLIRLFALLTFVAVAPALSAQDAPKPAAPSTAGDAFVGKWEGTLQGPQGDQRLVAQFKKDSTFAWLGMVTSDQGEMVLRSITIEGDKLTATATLDMGGQGLELWYTFTRKDDTLTGTIEASFNGQSMAFPMTLKKTP